MAIWTNDTLRDCLADTTVPIPDHATKDWMIPSRGWWAHWNGEDTDLHLVPLLRWSPRGTLLGPVMDMTDISVTAEQEIDGLEYTLSLLVRDKMPDLEEWRRARKAGEW